jgi:hypothetical protein
MLNLTTKNRSAFSKYYTIILSQAKQTVPGFSAVYAKFLKRLTLDQCSKSMITNYNRSIGNIALHFGRVPRLISV